MDVVDLGFLESALRDAVRGAVSAADRGLGEKLQSVLLVGAAVPPPRLRPGDPVELVAIVSDLPVPALSNLAHQLGALQPGLVRVHVFTEHELLRSADVFTLRLAEYAARSVVLLGANPLGDLHYTRGELRRSIEQTLRATAWRLRDAVLEGAAKGEAGRNDMVHVLREACAELVVVAYHVLSLLGESHPSGEHELLDRLADRVGTGARALVSIGARLDGGEDARSPVSLLADLLVAVDSVTAFVDQVGAGG